VQPRVLALRPLGLGDLLTVVPAFRGLLDAFPEARVQAAVRRPLAPLLELVPGGRRLEVVPARPLEPLPPESGGCDVAVNLHGRGPQSHRVLRAAGSRRIVAFRNDAVPDVDGPDWRPGEHEVSRWCRMLGETGIPADPARLEIDTPEQAAPAIAAGATLIHPGAASPARRWPVERWAEVARHEVATGRPVVLTGDADERWACEAVARSAGIPNTAVLAGQLEITALAATIAAAARVLCADTGVAHLATALGRPSLVLFGPTAPSEWGPPADRRHRVLWAGRRGDPHGDRPDPGLLALTPGAVIDELVTLSA
jgi:ADP-heptose:LPS heptosyltransferase